ncbi:DUF4003 family protein [Alteribacter aurantiacus]|uniref:DUF4003 family protein n=1 Tax=Alteribacter aurantiacus TaxID=254410 RepID=UPI0004261E79|nr:DUF4003 family protein [Alteribacter aurantiacus]
MHEHALNVKDKIDLLVQNEQAVKKATAWTGLDTKTRLLLAAMFANRHQETNADEFKDVANWIKEQTSAWSYIRGNIRFSVAANLMLYTDDPHKAFDEMMKTYEVLLEAGFRRHNATYLAALALTTQTPNISDTDREVLAKRAMTLYKEVRKGQVFNTNEYDYPLIVLLAKGRADDIQNIGAEVSDTYQKLRRGNWKRGNELQGITHILALDSEKSVDAHIDKANELFEEWEREIGRVRPAYYSEIGALTVRNAVKADIATVKKHEEKLHALSSFRWNKELGTIIAAQFTASSDLEESPLNEHMLTTLSILQQAEMAATMAAVGAVTVATTSGN